MLGAQGKRGARGRPSSIGHATDQDNSRAITCWLCVTP